MAVALDAREGEEIVDQAAQTQVLAGDQLEIAARLDRIEVAVIEQRVDQQPHRRQRRLELVRHGGHQIGFEPGEAQLPLECPPEHDGGSGDDCNCEEAGPCVYGDAPSRQLVGGARVRR